MRLVRGRMAFAGLILTAMLAGGYPARAAAPAVEVVPTDLAPLIDKVANYPSRFAVDVPFTASPETRGEWSQDGANSTWRYSVQIPTAVSMSFHAVQVRLPATATLRTTLNGIVYAYSAKDIHNEELWSRIGVGDTISFELELPTADRGQLRFDISSLQAGYRGLGHGVRNHQHYDQLRHAGTQSLTTEADPSGCSENWSCHVTSANSGPGQASAALIIGNVGLCTGALLNDVPVDGVPYILTARHCENGNSDGGNPEAANGIVVYWDAVTSCGSALGNFYDSGAVIQYGGARTVVEQQDAWLIRLNGPPLPNDVYYAGWDATGGSFVGGFTPHYAGGTSRQFVEWFGQAFYTTIPAATLSVHYDSTFWATVNAVGSAGPGSSGGGLFDEDGRLVGVHVRGDEQSVTGAGVCPVSSPTAPSAQYSTSWSTALSGIFSSTADPQSTTGTLTIQQVLDPANTGTKVVDGHAVQPQVNLFLQSASSLPTGGYVSLSWTSTHAASCTASGGEPGDGWAGSVGTGGSGLFTSIDGGSLTYTLTCGNPAGQATASVVVNWTLATPSVYLSGSPVVQLNTPFQLSWSSNVRPCTASGGTAGDGWSGTQARNGMATVSEGQVGSVTYTITCGSGARTASAQTTVSVAAPSVQVTADAVTLLVGQSVNISVASSGQPCSTSGGTSGDGWRSTVANGIEPVTETIPGTYTYTLSCGSGANVASAHATVTFVNGTPAVSLTPSSTSVPLGTSINFSWDSNVSPCTLNVSGPEGSQSAILNGPPHGTWPDVRYVLGTYIYTISCGNGSTTAQDSKTVTITGTPSVTLSQISPAAVATRTFVLQWGSNLAPCVASGGGPADGWAGPLYYRNGVQQLVETSGGNYTYTVTCGTGSLTQQAQLTVNVLPAPPSVTVTADKTFQLIGQPVTVSWNTTATPCSAAGGYPGDGWNSQSIPSSGSQSVTENSQIQVTYFVSCGVPPLDTSGYVNVSFVPVLAPNLSASVSTVAPGQSVVLTWSSLDGSSCQPNTTVGTVNGWSGNLPASGNATITTSISGDITFILQCGASPPATVKVTFAPSTPISTPAVPPTVQITASSSSVTTSDPITLTWTTTNASSCIATGGGGSDGWSGSVAATGSTTTVHEPVGSYNYAITCSGSAGTTPSMSIVTVKVTAPSVTVSGSTGGGGGGGGGLLGWLDLTVLGGLLASSRSVRRRSPYGQWCRAARGS